MKRIFFPLLLVFLANLTFAHEPVYTTVKGSLYKQGKPLSNVMIISCEDLLNFGRKSCEHPIKVFTDINGDFSFSVQTGYPPCTVCPCSKDKPSSCDPIFGFWFSVISGNDSREFLLEGLGFGIKGEIPLKCDVQPTDSKPELRLMPYGTSKYRLPELKC